MRKKNSQDFDFYYGAMGSAKTAQLLMKYFNCKNDNGMKATLFKPSIDDRYGVDFIKSRTGLEAEAITINSKTNILDLVLSFDDLPHIIMLDEVQFLVPNQIEQLKSLADYHQVSVDVYGLKNNFRGKLFGEETGTIKRVIELATNIIEIESFCACGNTATNIARYNPENWNIQKEGEEIVIGGNDRYVSLCYKCWNKDTIPRTTRVRLLNGLFEEETKKGANADLKALYSIKDKINYEKGKILEEEIGLLKEDTLKAEVKIKKLTSKKDGK